MTNRSALLASVSLVASLLAVVAMWLLAFADESTSGLVVFGAALSVLAIAGLVIKGEAEVRVPRVSGRWIAGSLVLLLVGVIVLAAVVDRVDDSGIGRSNAGASNNGADPASGTTGDPVANDAERRRELQVLSAALADYRSVNGSYPTTSNNVQSACNYPVDKLCLLEPKLGKDAFLDPRGVPGVYGYWYKSDGSSFILFASMESEVASSDSCPVERHLQEAHVQNVLCVRSP
jgi:hypothetical protein